MGQSKNVQNPRPGRFAFFSKKKVTLHSSSSSSSSSSSYEERRSRPLRSRENKEREK